MQVCPVCGEQNPDRFRLCGFCGAALTPTVAQSVRKTVTVVFSDLVGSTSLGEQLDTEALREVLSRYFDRMKDDLQRHGGTVEKFIGDAVMAVFGLPRVREDDAVRGVRAAWEMKHALDELNEDLERTWGVRLSNRTGVNTGEVVAGDVSAGQRLVTGDAVNTAARLEQAAPAGEILIGDLTYRLVRSAADVEAMPPLTLKGKAEQVPAFRLLGVRRHAEGIARRLDLPMVGREGEIALLDDAFARAIDGRSCQLVTLLGSAGVGKSRIVAEFLGHVAGTARAIRGRCLLYGEGVTFWPLAEAVRQAAGIDEDEDIDVSRSKLAALEHDEVHGAADRVASVIGLSTEVFPLEETFWGVRRLLETLALRVPLVVVFEDIHWAEATFLDLIQHLAGAIQAAPVLIVCAARRDLLDEHPGWDRARANEQITRLESLSNAESELVLENLLGRAGLEQRALARITQAAEGNPLFLEQMLSMLLDDGVLRQDGSGRLVLVGDASAFDVPPTILSLLAARLDRLAPDERAAVERGSVIGQVFSKRGLEAISPNDPDGQVGVSLRALTAKQLIQPDGTLGEEAFRFHHGLIRDAAYQGLLKRARAELHERFAAWLEDEGGGTRILEIEEIVGYHFEQAHRYLAELGRLDARAHEIGARGAEHLASAGRRAFARGDAPAAANLLRRAAALLPSSDPVRSAMLPDLGEVLMDLGEFAEADSYLGEAIEQAGLMRDRRLEAEAGAIRALFRFNVAPATSTEDVIRDAKAAIVTLEEAGDHAGLAKAWRVLSAAYGASGRYGRAEQAVERVIEHARAAGDRRQETRVLPSFAMSAMYGPMPVVEAIRRCEQLLDTASGDRRSEALILCALTQLHAMDGSFDLAREASVRARADLEEIGARVMAAGTALDAGTAELLAGRAEEAERLLRSDYEDLERRGEQTLRSTMAGLLGLALLELGRYEEAERLSRVGEEIAAEDDRESQALWRRVRGRVLAEAGSFAQAEALVRGAVGYALATDAPVMQADTLMDLAEVLALAGKPEEAEQTLNKALGLHERKLNRVGAARAEAALRRISPGRTPTEGVEPV